MSNRQVPQPVTSAARHSHMTADQHAAHREHQAWLDECGRWRSQHRRALALLAKVQAAILEQEAALESHAAQVQSHDAHLQKYCLTDFQPGHPDYEFLEQEHVAYTLTHERARQSHERLRKRHLDITNDVDRLLVRCESGM